MRRLLFVCLVSAFFSPSIFGQTPTLVTGTITDVNGLPYSNARVSAQLIPSTATPTIIVNGIPTQIGGQNNATALVDGSFSMNLFCNTAGGGCSVISPAATLWQITVTTNGTQPPFGTGPQACTATVTITGATQSLTTNFSACPAQTRTSSLSGLPGNGNVTTVSAGNLPPVFTTLVATPSTTPAISYSLSNAAANTVFGNCTLGVAPPAFCSLTSAMLPASGPGSGTVTSFSYAETGIDPLYSAVVTNPATTPTLTETANLVQPGLFLRGPIPSGSTTNPTFENSGVNASTVNGTTVTVSAAPAAATTAAIFFGITATGQNVPSPDGTWTNFPGGAGTISGSLPRFKNISSSAKLTASSTIGASDSWSSSLAFLGGTITAVTNATFFSNTCGTGCSTATMGAVTGGHTIVIYGAWASANIIPSDVRATDNTGNFYFRMLFAPNVGSNGHFALIAQNVTAGTPTITLNTTAQINFGATIAFELTGPTAYYSGINGPWQFGPLTLTDLAAAGAQTVQTFVNKNLSGSVAITLNTLTTIDSVTVTIPNSGGPWRARVSYNYYKSGGLQFNCYVTDNVAPNLFAGYDMQTTGSANVQGCNGQQMSPVTYAPGTSVTFTVKIFDVGNSTITTTSNVHTPSGVSSMQVELVSSN